MDLICEVCKENPAKGVASSSCGPISVAYCDRCLSYNAEPYWLIANTLECIGGIQNLAPWAQHWNTWKDGRYVTVMEAFNG